MAIGSVQLSSAPSLPTNYEYYTSGGIKHGLSTDQSYFTLNDRNITIYSGAMHYFRVPRAYWRDRLRKMRAAGLNTVETYVPWNLHEPHSGVYDFGNGNDDMSDFLHLEEFLKTAQEEDLLAIVRPGPFICAEFEFGGFPSWLLRDDGLRVRTSESQYMKFVARYFKVLIPILAALQFINGGPIIMFQVENEYANSGIKDFEYLRQLRELMLDLGIKEVLSTTDNPDKGYYGTIKGQFFMTANFGTDSKTQLDMFKKLQPGKPLVAMEYWTGGTDYWGANVSDHQTAATFARWYKGILEYPASVNIYMFHGGTDFGFLNGALNLESSEMEGNYQAFISSYDMFAPLSESGDYTDKYYVTKSLIEKYNPIKTKIPEMPKIIKPVAYNNITIEEYLQLSDMVKTLDSVHSKKVIPMEKLSIYNNSGQNFGYTVYRKKLAIPADAVLQIEGKVCDAFMVLVNGELLTPWLEKSSDLNKTGTSHVPNPTITLSKTALKDAVLDIVVENWGRVNVGEYNQSKGLCQGQIKLNNAYLYDWDIFPLEFKTNWTKSLSNWQKFDEDRIHPGPAMFKGVLILDSEPRDTFVHMENWRKGIVIVNNFVIGRYARMGPIQTLYLPAPFLKKGKNEIIVFEHFKFDKIVEFSEKHIYKLY